MKKQTINEFRAKYPNEDVCLETIFQLRYGNLKVCPSCSKETTFSRVKDRRAYQCAKCAYQLYPTAGSIFEKTTTSLVDWFYIIYLQTTTRNGVSAKEIERQLDVCYVTALRMAHKIKELMGSGEKEKLNGEVESDETFFGGKVRFMHAAKRKELGNKAFSHRIKTPVIAMVQRKGKVVTKVVDVITPNGLNEFVTANLDKDARLITDTSFLYYQFDKKFRHDRINHEQGEYGKGDIHTNTVENFFSVLKRTIKGTHIHVSKKHLQKYVDEVAFRYMNRENQDVMFDKVLNKLA